MVDTLLFFDMVAAGIIHETTADANTFNTVEILHLVGMLKTHQLNRYSVNPLVLTTMFFSKAASPFANRVSRSERMMLLEGNP